MNRRALRDSSTLHEIILWSRLRRKQLGYRFKRQHSIGSYVVDFYCPKKKIIIELDGWHHGEKDHVEYDKERTKLLESLGFTVLRFWNGEVNRNLEGLIFEIKKYL